MQLNAVSLAFVAAVVLATARLWHAGQLPRMLTFHGANFDILIGLSAPVVAVLYARHAIDPRGALLWNVVGIVSLANVVVRNVLISPAIHLISTEVPNAAIGSFPYSFIPAFMVPLALVLHVLAIRSLSIIRNPIHPSVDGPNCHAVGRIAS